MRAFQIISKTIAVVAMMLVALAVASQAATPTGINVQGRLTDATGTAVPDGTYSVVFTIYDAPSGGTSKWAETELVTTSGGLFSVVLGVYTGGLIPPPITDTVFNGSTRYLGVKVGTDPELTPRTQLVTAPYAFRVSTVDGATGGAISGNINLDGSTAISGNILKGGVPFIHNFGGLYNTFIGLNAGNFTMFGSAQDNTGCGAAALENNSRGINNTGCGFGALFSNTGGDANTASGYEALYLDTNGYDNTAAGANALYFNTSGNNNTATGLNALLLNTSGSQNTANGTGALNNNTTGTYNTAIGYAADVSTGNLTNTTAIGYAAVVNASNKIRLGNANVTVIEGQVAYTFTSDRNQKENFRSVDGDDVLRKIRGLSLTSWNYKKQDPSKFRHYGPVAQEFFAAFGHDVVGQCGDSTSINSGDETGILFAAVQALEKKNEALEMKNQALEQRIAEIVPVRDDNKNLRSELDDLKKMVSQLMAQSKPDGTAKFSIK